MSYWDPARHADRRPLLLARGRIKAAIRAWFEGRGYIEVEPGALVASPGNETHLHAFAAAWRDEAGASRQMYLHTSPEFAMKKLLAAGEKKIFTFSPCFRNREQASALHAPEFTMLEWYEAGAPYEALMEQCAEIVRLAAESVGNSTWTFRGRTMSATAAPKHLPVASAFAEAGIDLAATLCPDRTPNRDGLATQAQAIGVRVAPDDTWSDLFSRVLVERIEPRLGEGALTMLCEYPLPEAALARALPRDPRFAERFEMYACGVELANGFGELTDAGEQRARFEAAMAEKERLYGERHPLDEGFLAALAHMPAASGCALGFDRLVMLATGAPRLADVMWTPL